LPEGAADYIVRGRGDTPVRSISDLMTCAWRSTGWILVRVRPASPPMGVRAGLRLRKRVFTWPNDYLQRSC